MATVYVARDVKHGRLVAVKAIHADLAASLGPERFLREIEITAKLTHPHILPLYDSGEAAGMLYYVMPFIDGESLRDRLDREGALAIDDTLAIARQVGSALSYAHGLGIVHRDIKPENILMSGRDVLVSDFGIARAVTAAGGARLTSTGIAIGTFDCMAPEQAAGEAGIDARADVYALGVVVYEMLAGEPPFSGPSLNAIIAKKLSHPVPSLRAVRGTVTEELELAIRKSLAPARADRFATVEQFTGAITGEAIAWVSVTRRDCRGYAQMTPEPLSGLNCSPLRLNTRGATWRSARFTSNEESTPPLRPLQPLEPGATRIELTGAAPNCAIGGATLVWCPTPASVRRKPSIRDYPDGRGCPITGCTPTASGTVARSAGSAGRATPARRAANRGCRAPTAGSWRCPAARSAR
jgi:serine/threonine protein kinase